MKKTIHVWHAEGALGESGYAAYVVERKSIRAWDQTRDGVVRDLILTAKSFGESGNPQDYKVEFVTIPADAPYGRQIVALVPPSPIIRKMRMP